VGPGVVRVTDEDGAVTIRMRDGKWTVEGGAS
jgi:hypothetical protein